MVFETELKRLGLKSKEAAVYLACLELGSSPVQNIARKARVVRATTYVVLESLMNRGLVTRYKEGKKTMFSAEPPRQLMRILEKEREGVDERQRDLEQLLPELQVLMKAAGGRPSVRYFQGKEGLHVMRQEIVMYSKPGDMVYNFTPVDHLIAVFPEDESAYYNQRAARGILSRTIFTTRSKALINKYTSREYSVNSERRYIPPKSFTSTSGMTIYGDRVAIGNFVGKQMGVIIESQPIASMMKNIFELAWQSAGEQKETKKQRKVDSR